MGNENSLPQKPLDFVVDIPVCTNGNEHSIHVQSSVEGSHRLSNKIKYPELNCPIATECLMQVNLPVVSGTIINSTPDILNAQFKHVHQCVKDRITPRSQAVSSVQPRPRPGSSPSAPPPSQPVHAASQSHQVKEHKIMVIPLCDGQYKRLRPPPPGSTMPRISKDGFYIFRGGRSEDYISVQLDKLTCKEALQCMNKLELSFDSTREQVKRYKDTKNRTVDELQNSIRNQCVNAPTPPVPSPPPPSPPSTDDATEVDDFLGIGVSQNVVLIGVGGAMMAAAALALRAFQRKNSNLNKAGMTTII